MCRVYICVCVYVQCTVYVVYVCVVEVRCAFAAHSTTVRNKRVSFFLLVRGWRRRWRRRWRRQWRPRQPIQRLPSSGSVTIK